MSSNKDQSVLYKADSQLFDVLGKARERCHSVCSRHYYRPVRVQTVHGQQYEGRIVNMDHYHLYLEVQANAQMRQFFPPYGPYASPYSSTILPLVLFDLLTITLLTT